MSRYLFATPGNPPRLVTQDEASVAADAAGTALEVATNWWLMAPILLVGTAAILVVWIRLDRARRLSDEEKAFRALARACRMSRDERRLTEHLARAHQKAAPVALLLSDSALTAAASRIELKPRSSGDRLLRRLLDRRGLADPRPKASPAKNAGKGAPGRKAGAPAPKKTRLSLRA
jgi:hypothetical protein